MKLQLTRIELAILTIGIARLTREALDGSWEVEELESFTVKDLQDLLIKLRNERITPKGWPRR
jgi:hypothetical protein